MRSPIPPAQAGALELRLLGARGVREGSLLSIKVGSKRCYVPYFSENIGDSLCKFSNLVATGPEQVKLDVYEPVAHGRLLAEPTDAHWDVDLVRRPSTFGQEEEDESGDSSANTGDGAESSQRGAQSSRSGDAGMSLEFEAKRASGLSKLVTSEEEPADSPDVAQGEPGCAEQRRDEGLRASKASPYEEKHDLLKVMQTLLKSVMAEKPPDPYAYMIQVLESKSHACAEGKVARPQSAAVRRPSRTEACQSELGGASAARREVRPQSAISRATRPSFGPLPCTAPKLSPKRPSEPLAPVGKAKPSPASFGSLPRLSGCGLAPLEAEERGMPVGAARNVASRVRAPALTLSTPSLALPGTSVPSLSGDATPASPSTPKGRRSPSGEASEVQKESPRKPDDTAAEMTLKPSLPDKLCDLAEAQTWNTTSTQSTASPHAQQGGEEYDIDEEGVIVSDQPDDDQEASGTWACPEALPPEERQPPGAALEALRPERLEDTDLRPASGMIDSVVIGGSVPLELWSPHVSASDAGLTEVASIPDRCSDRMSVAAGLVSREIGDTLRAVPWGA